MNFPKETYRLEITSWCGISPGAEHLYAKISTPAPEWKDIRLSRDVGLEEAKYLDEKDGCVGKRWSWESQLSKGPVPSERFNSREQVYEAAVKYATENDIKWLVENDSIQANRVIVAPEHIDVKRLNELAEQLDKLNTNDRRNDHLWDQIDKEYFKLINQSI